MSDMPLSSPLSSHERPVGSACADDAVSLYTNVRRSTSHKRRRRLTLALKVVCGREQTTRPALAYQRAHGARAGPMRGYLADIERGLDEARQKLRAQYVIVCKMDRFHLHDALRKLLANGLRRSPPAGG